MTTVDATAVVAQLLAAAGGRVFGTYLAEFEKLDESACDTLFAVFDATMQVSIGAAGAHPRDVNEDVWYTLVVAARLWPKRFIDHVLADPRLHDSITVLDALGEVDRPEARQLLLTAVRQRQAGHAYGRRYAMQSLIRLADPRVPDLLVDLLKDRDHSVGFAAVAAAIDNGDARLLPRLRHIAEAAKTLPGTREYALDAIEAIVVREGLTDLELPTNAAFSTCLGQLPEPRSSRCYRFS